MQAMGDILFKEKCDSTNSELERISDGACNFLAVAAREQTSGRGQGSHSWTSAPGENLTFSLLLDFAGAGEAFAVGAGDILLISCTVALGIRDYLLEKGVVAEIKWPNDIWVRGKKICGILIENRIEDGRVTRSIVGIGLNLNQTEWPRELPNPVSLKELTGERYDVAGELPEVREKIYRRFLLLSENGGRDALLKEFGECSFRLP